MANINITEQNVYFASNLVQRSEDMYFNNGMGKFIKKMYL